jgi:spermidine synthase
MGVRDQVPRLSFHELHPNGYSLIYELDSVHVHQKTRFQDLAVVETRAFGRALFLDGLIQSAEADEAIYHEALIHPGMIIHGNPRRVLIGGTGEGATLREVLRHSSVERVLTVDLDDQVVDACKRWLPSWHAGSFDDPRVEVRTEDVRETLAAESASEPWDVVVMDVTEPIEGGPATDLFTPEFYRSVAKVMADDGILIVQGGEVEPMHLDNSVWVVNLLREVFDMVQMTTMFVPSFFSLWGIVVCAKSPVDLIPGDLEERVGRLPTEELDFYDAVRHQAIVTPPAFLSRRL